MSDHDLTELRRTAEAATPGPWKLNTSEATMNDRAQYRFGDLRRPAAFLAHQMRGVDAIHIATFDPPTVLDLLDRLEAAERAVDHYTTQRAELRQVLSSIAERLDEFSYDELSSVIEDEPLDHWGERYASNLDRLCMDTITDRDEQHRQSTCLLPKGHGGEHNDLDGCVWTGANHHGLDAASFAETCCGKCPSGCYVDGVLGS